MHGIDRNIFGQHVAGVRPRERQHAHVAGIQLDGRAPLLPRDFRVPHEIDDAIARKKLSTLGITIDTLTDEQKKYLGV